MGHGKPGKPWNYFYNNLFNFPTLEGQLMCGSWKVVKKRYYFQRIKMQNDLKSKK